MVVGPNVSPTTTPLPPSKSLSQIGQHPYTWVHCDEVANGGVHGDVLVHELKPLLLLTNGILDALDL